MRAPAEVRLEKLQRILEQVEFETERGAVIVVEGQKDRDSLRKLGIKGTIQCTQSSRRNTVGFVEELDGTRKVLVLTDFDRQGVFLAKRLGRLLTSQKTHTDLTIWRELRRLARSDIRSIEELPRLYERLQAESILSGYPQAWEGLGLPLPDNRTVREYGRRRVLGLKRKHEAA